MYTVLEYMLRNCWGEQQLQRKVHMLVKEQEMMGKGTTRPNSTLCQHWIDIMEHYQEVESR